MAMLEVENVQQRFGGLVALSGVSFRVERGQIKAVIGPNGAGKTTLFNAISGLRRPTGGKIFFNGVRIDARKQHEIAQRGISRTFQNPSLFLRMTALENVMVGRHIQTRQGFIASALRLPAQRREERAIREAAMARLAETGLGDCAGVAAGSLSFGQRRMVELARALATDPQLLLLDEPASGLNTRETDNLARLIARIRDSGVTVLLVEHDMSLVMDISDDILVLHFGTPIAEGPPAAVRDNPDVIAVYLGGTLNHAAS